MITYDVRWGSGVTAGGSQAFGNYAFQMDNTTAVYLTRIRCNFLVLDGGNFVTYRGFLSVSKALNVPVGPIFKDGTPGNISDPLSIIKGIVTVSDETEWIGKIFCAPGWEIALQFSINNQPNQVPPAAPYTAYCWASLTFEDL